MKRIKPTIGDIFEIDLQNGKRYVQYIANDMTQLNSDVIRVFKTHYPAGEPPSIIEDIVKDEVDFYSHVTGVEFGVKDGTWEKIGNSKNLGDLNKPFFRSSGDYGNSKVEVSEDWYVWHINEPMLHVGKLSGENTKAEIGSVTSPKSIAERVRTGKRTHLYPGY